MHFRLLKMIATSGFVTALECTKFAPDPAEGDYSAPPDSLAGLRGPTSKGNRRGGERRTGEKERRAGEKKGRERKEGEGPLSLANLWIRPCEQT